MANEVWPVAKEFPFLDRSCHDIWYEIWKVRMEAYLMSLDGDIWLYILNGERMKNTKRSS